MVTSINSSTTSYVGVGFEDDEILPSQMQFTRKNRAGGARKYPFCVCVFGQFKGQNRARDYLERLFHTQRP